MRFECLNQYAIMVDGDEKDDDEEVEDQVTKEDMSDAVLLAAQLTALLATVGTADTIYDMFKQAYGRHHPASCLVYINILELHRDNANALIEMNAFVCRLGCSACKSTKLSSMRCSG